MMYTYDMLSFGYGLVAIILFFAVTELTAFLNLQIISHIKGRTR